MKKIIAFSFLTLMLSSCWPESFMTPKDNSMPKEWKTFFINPIEVTTATAPSSYGAVLSETMRTNIQNNTRLKLDSKVGDSTLQISSIVTAYNTSPLAIQDGDVATQNRLTISVSIVITTPTKGLEEIRFTASRFADYSASQQLVDVEQGLIESINQQIVQDVIVKLQSNW
jgi:hypothetical protein